MKKIISSIATLTPLGIVAALGILFETSSSDAQVPPGLLRFGTTGVFTPQVGNCLSILAVNSSGQVATDSQTPCSPALISTAYTNATTAYTPIMAMPAVAAGTTVRGECTLTYSMNNTAGTATFALGASAAPTDLWVTANPTTGAFVAPTFTTITSTTTTAVTGALVTTAANANYQVYLSFTMVAGTSPVTVTAYAQSNNASYTVTVQPGSSCAWVP